MGSSVLANCPCGVEAQIMIGGGMMDHETCCLFPCCCEKCNSLVEANIWVKRLRCPKCRSVKLIPYTDPRLMGEKGSGVVESWDDRTLTDGTYKCPKCEQMTLRFSNDMCLLWD